MKLTPKERDTVLAALRQWQNGIRPDRSLTEDALNDIATDGNAHAPLTYNEINELCEKLNQ